MLTSYHITVWMKEKFVICLKSCIS